MSERANPKEKIKGLDGLRKAFKMKPLKLRKEKPVICRICKKEMTQVGTNVWQCHNENKGKDGKTKICGNIYIRKGYR